MADNVGNADARPDLDLEAEFGDDRPTVTEQELADVEAPCGAVGIGIPIGGAGETPSEASAGAHTGAAGAPRTASEIGRASCRERV